jgi:hypothetical protein
MGRSIALGADFSRFAGRDSATGDALFAIRDGFFAIRGQRYASADDFFAIRDHYCMAGEALIA